MSWYCLIHTISESSHVVLSVKISKEADHFAPWVEAAKIALKILKIINVDDIREPSLLNIPAQRNDQPIVPQTRCRFYDREGADRGTQN